MSAPMDAMLDAVEWEVLPPMEPDPDGLPYATHRGILTIMGHEFECCVLSTGQRVITAESIERLFGHENN